jgi:hypothetical protein
MQISAGRCIVLQDGDTGKAKEDPAMTNMTRIASWNDPTFSPLLLSDRLLTLAEDADKAGFRTAAERLLHLASKVLDQPTRQRQ